jgi:hypothetical protein
MEHSCDLRRQRLPWRLSYGTVTGMKSETGRNVSDAAEESDSERRRRRRRRRKKKTEGLSKEVRKLLLLARWAMGGLAMLATWAYGIYVYSTTALGWGSMIFFPAGIAAMVCISYALAVPFLATIGLIVGFMLKIDSGPLIALQRGAMAFVGVGGLNAIWRVIVFFLTRREITPNEAGYK